MENQNFHQHSAIKRDSAINTMLPRAQTLESGSVPEADRGAQSEIPLTLNV